MDKNSILLTSIHFSYTLNNKFSHNDHIEPQKHIASDRKTFCDVQRKSNNVQRLSHASQISFIVNLLKLIENSSPKSQSDFTKADLWFTSTNKVLPLYEKGLMTPTLLTAHLTIPMIYLGYLIKNNPCTFLLIQGSWHSQQLCQSWASLKFFVFFCLHSVFMRLITQKKDNKYQIERIYMTERGDLLEIWLANKIRRKLKNTEDQLYIAVKDMKNPPVGDNELPLKGTLFPQSFNNMEVPMPWQYGWYKYDFSRENYIIPKNF